MKRKSTLLIAAIVVVMIAAICAVTLTACDKTNTKVIDEFYKKFEGSGNFTIDMSVSPLAVMFVTMKVDGDKAYTRFDIDGEIEEGYVETVDNKVYEYYKEGETWYKNPGTSLDDIEDDDESTAISIKGVKNMLSGENYEYSKSEKQFVHKDPASVEFGTLEGLILSKVTVKIEGSKCKIGLTTAIEGINVTYVLAIYDIGATSVTIPQAEERHDGQEIDAFFDAMMQVNNFELLLTMTDSTTGESEVVRYLTDADKYQMIDTADNSTEYYYEQQVGNYYVLYKYTRDGSNWKKEQVVEFDFIINENETYEMLFSSMYEWSAQDRVYKLAQGQSFSIFGGEYEITAATLSFDGNDCVVEFSCNGIDLVARICNLGSVEVTLPTINS